MANKKRGEIIFRVDGKDFILRPTFEALCNAEAAAGCSFFELAQKSSSGQLTALQMAKIVDCVILKDSPGVDAIGEAMMETGLTEAVVPVIKFLEAALQGGRIAKN